MTSSLSGSLAAFWKRCGLTAIVNNVSVSAVMECVAVRIRRKTRQMQAFNCSSKVYSEFAFLMFRDNIAPAPPDMLQCC